MSQQYDIAIIGAGPGGYIAAIRAAQAGLKTVCIDKRAELGGTCLNVGCIPSKSLLQSTELLFHLQRDGKELGVEATGTSANFSQMMDRKSRIVKGLTDSIAALFKHHGIDFIQGEAHFLDPHTLEVDSKDPIQAKFILLATGSEPIPLPNLPFDERQVLSSTGALSLNRIPQRMAVIGGGVIGVELASVYRRLGSEVTIIEMLDRICPALDHSLSQALLNILKKQGIQFHLSTKLVTAVIQPEEAILTLDQGDKLSNLSAEAVLVSVGRRPYTQGLGLEKIGISVTSKGFIPVDSCFRTNHAHIFAIGDVIEGTMLAHRASEEGTAVVDFMIGKASLVNYMAIPNVLYTYPEVAALGMTEKEAKEAGLQVKAGTSFFKGNARARCSGDTEGFVKIVGEQQTGRVVGLHIIGAHASELIAEGMIAIEKKATLQDIAHAAHAHPTLSEAIKEAAASALGRPIHG